MTTRKRYVTIPVDPAYFPFVKELKLRYSDYVKRDVSWSEFLKWLCDEVFGERDLLDHAVSAHQDQIHVPLIVKYPGQVAARVDARNASGVDVMPTILDVLDLAGPEGLAGLSLLEPDAQRPIVAESYPNGYLTRYSDRFETRWKKR